MSRRRLKTHSPVNGDCGQEYRGLGMDGEFTIAGCDAAKFAAWPGTGADGRHRTSGNAWHDTALVARQRRRQNGMLFAQAVSGARKQHGGLHLP